MHEGRPGLGRLAGVRPQGALGSGVPPLLLAVLLCSGGCASRRPAFFPASLPAPAIASEKTRPQPGFQATSGRISVALRAPDGRPLWEAEAEGLSGSSSTRWHLRGVECRWLGGSQPLTIRAPHLEWEPDRLLLRAPQGGKATWGNYHLQVRQLDWSTKAGILTAEGELSLTSPDLTLRATRLYSSQDLSQAHLEEVSWQAAKLGLQGTARKASAQVGARQAQLKQVELQPEDAPPLQAERMQLDFSAPRWTAYQVRSQEGPLQWRAARLSGGRLSDPFTGEQVEVVSPQGCLTARSLERHGQEWRFHGQVVARLTSPQGVLRTDQLRWQPPYLEAQGGYQWTLDDEVEVSGKRLTVNTETGEMEGE